MPSVAIGRRMRESRCVELVCDLHRDTLVMQQNMVDYTLLRLIFLLQRALEAMYDGW